MSGADKGQKLARGIWLILLILSIFGPWAYDLDGVPPPEWCHEPLVLLENGRCAKQTSGAEIISFFWAVILEVIHGVVTGIKYRALEIVGPLAILSPGLPVITTLLLIWRARPRLQIIHVCASTLAAGLALAAG